MDEAAFIFSPFVRFSGVENPFFFAEARPSSVAAASCQAPHFPFPSILRDVLWRVREGSPKDDEGAHLVGKLEMQQQKTTTKKKYTSIKKKH